MEQRKPSVYTTNLAVSIQVVFGEEQAGLAEEFETAVRNFAIDWLRQKAYWGSSEGPMRKWFAALIENSFKEHHFAEPARDADWT